jgi:alpha-galactosidase
MTPVPPKVAFVGAGSVKFTSELIRDMLHHPELKDLSIALYDIDPDRLATAERLAKRTAEVIGARGTIEAHTDRRRALDGAAYVVNAVQVGMHAATVTDFDIPARYGLPQTIGDTLGIGGIFRALRTIPVLLDVAGDMDDVCPEAWLLNYTNPMAMLCQAVSTAYPELHVVGLCHSIQHTTRHLADLVGVPFEDVTYLGAGMNHQSFILRFERDGESLYPRLDERIAREPELARRARIEIYRRIGYFPTESGEHTVEYVPWFLRDANERERLRIPVGEYIRRSEATQARYERTRADVDAGWTIDAEPGLEYAAEIVHSIQTGRPRVIYGTVRNDGLIDGLPEQIAVEVPCLVDDNGVLPVRVGALPPQCAALNRSFANVCDLTVAAALEGRRDHVLHAAILDPHTAATLTLDRIGALVDEMLEAHRALLPKALAP